LTLSWLTLAGKSPAAQRRNRMEVLKASMIAVLLGATPLPGLAQTPPAKTAAPKAPASCAAPEYRQLDFWIGDWDAYDLADANKRVARNRVDAILDGCALREVYEQTDGLVGQSFSVYDASRKVWHQTWVTNHGQLLVIEGRFQDGRLTLTGTQPAAAGPPKTVRAVWYPQEEGVRETAEASGDGGKTWKPLFDILFRAHKR
jgi:hypothetical protein